MKKKAVIFILLIVSVLTLSARPQFFFGGGAEWGRVYPSDDMYSLLKENKRYYGTIGSDRQTIKYLSFLIPKAEITVIPYTDFPLGVTFNAGYGFVTGMNTGLSTYSYSVIRSSDHYRYGSDEVLLLSGGLTYIHLAESEKYFSISGSLKYNWNRYTLSKTVIPKGTKVSERDNTVIDEHSLSMALAVMGRYDAKYFRIDASLRKDIDFGKGISSLWEGKDYSLTVSATFGGVFTILRQNQFMR